MFPRGSSRALTQVGSLITKSSIEVEVNPENLRLGFRV